MRIANCKLQIAEAPIFNSHFSISRLQCVAVIVPIVALVCRLTISAEPKLLPQQLLDYGWISLFDGESLFGWQPVGEAKWEVKNGEIRTKGEKPGWLMTTTEWADFRLLAEFRAPPDTNSGIFLRTGLQPKDPTRDCFEINIALKDTPFQTGSLVGRQKAVAPNPYFEPAIWIPTLKDPTKWHTFGIRVEGGVVDVMLDDRPILTYADSFKSTIKVGRIGLQSNHGPVAFRNIRLRPSFFMDPLFEGRDIKAWDQARAEKCKFDVTKEGELHLTNGPGQIDTKADFQNFVLQLECKVNGDGLNSGIFFRTLRKGRWAGYESQIQNSYKDGDRTKPKDYGTGAIYRRQAARRIVANDHEWFTKTIVADGPHMAVWVNGYQVSDWTDTRPEKENAREGKRLGGGAIAIQGHDKTTDFLFRNIRAAELPAERSEVGGQRSDAGGHTSR
jgi:hypothetical protein